MSDLTNRIAAHWREDVTRAYDKARRFVEEDAAARGMVESGIARANLKSLDVERDRLFEFVTLSASAASASRST